MEFVSPDLDVLLDDFVLHSLSFLPSHLQLSNASELVLSREASSDRASELTESSGRLYVRGLKVSARDISFWLRRKRWPWLPCLREEWGLIEVSLERKGLEADVSYMLSKGADDEGEDTRSGFLIVQAVRVRLSRYAGLQTPSLVQYAHDIDSSYTA